MTKKESTKKVSEKKSRVVSETKSKTVTKKKTLVIVESPAKARTIHKYLGRNFQVLSSMGHIIDLPRSRLAVNIQKDFEPDYITVRGRGKILEEIKKSAMRAKEVFLAPDNDREGEAIAWSIQNVLLKSNPDMKIRRIVFNEITKTAILRAMEHPSAVNMNKVNAQKARRVLDRIVGYHLSPLLWEKLKKGLSAGRVQSATLKLICDREREIKAFNPEEYWLFDGLFHSSSSSSSSSSEDSLSQAKKTEKRTAKEKKEDQLFPARLIQYEGEKLKISNEKEALSLKKELEKESYTVQKFLEKKQKRHPVSPFTTSDLQQDSFQKLHFTTDRTMRIAQSLYEGVDLGKERTGLITYMRTDSTRVSDSALSELRSYIRKTWGEEFLPSNPNSFRNAKGSQDAHEAIRPTSVSRTPVQVAPFLSEEQNRLYRLIWSRFVASQMASAEFLQRTLDIIGVSALLRTSFSRIHFEGFLKVYGSTESLTVEDRKNFVLIASLKEGDPVDLRQLDASQHFTQAPPSYTEASLVKKLKDSGIGRPSTYSPTILVLLKRNYVSRVKRVLHPTKLGFLTYELLEQFFIKIIREDFTAHMESLLDQVEEEKLDWVRILKDFFGDFAPILEKARQETKDMKSQLDEETGEICEKCESPMIKKLGRFGYFLACSGFPKCRNAKPVPISDCPICSGKLVLKRSTKKKGQTFYGCNRYPECEFLSREAPLEDTLCKICSKPLFAQGKKASGRNSICKNSNCENFHEVPKQKTA